MIIVEDKSFEDEVINTGYHIALPFELAYNAVEGGICITVYSFCFNIAREFEKKFAAEPFSEEARTFLRDKISPIMQELGYDCTDAAYHAHLEYYADGDISTDGMCACDIIKSLDGEKFDELPLDEFIFDPDDPCDCMAVIRQDGKIVCYAGLNDISDSDGYYEITVECQEAYRGKGFATSCVAHLAKHILSCGERVKYVCTDENIASQKTAEAAGFRFYKKCLPFVCYKNTKMVDDEVIF